MMRHWLTRDDPSLARTTIKRFDPSHWTVDFPRGSMACVVSHPGEDRITVTINLARKGDLVGLIYSSSDDHTHVAHRRETSRDYRRCKLRFHWKSSGLVALDAVNGPTLTIEGRDSAGASATWYVRLWNYAVGTPTDAEVTIDFDHLQGGFSLPADAQDVEPGNIDRMFISLVAPAYVSGSSEPLPSPLEGEVEISDITCTGSGSMLSIKDAVAPEHHYRICTAYDDCYNLTPERIVDSIDRLGYRELINHYVGMSHYPALTPAGLVDVTSPICTAARRWHESFAEIAAERGYDVIWSISFELLEQFCPESWKQRDVNWAPARTGYLPPSTLLSPAVAEAMSYLGRVAAAFVQIGQAAGMVPMVQIGEPWWWVTADNTPCLYDAGASSLWPAHSPITDVRNVSEAQKAVLDRAGEVLSNGTRAIITTVQASVPSVRTHVLAYLPDILRADAPELVRANLPLGWQKPAFDVLQIEDYSWASAGFIEQSQRGAQQAITRLGYVASERHYLAGFAGADRPAHDWRNIMAAASQAEAQGTGEVFVWALPQVARDGLTIFRGDDEVEAFKDVQFPLEIGCQAVVEPGFSTTIFTSAAGYEYRNVNWTQSRTRFDVGPGVRSMEDLQTLLHFFRRMRGSACAFRFRDVTDFSSSDMTGEPAIGDVVLGQGDSERRRFELCKAYGDGELRRITRPDASSIRIGLAGVESVGWTLSEGGVIEFEQAPSTGVQVTAGFYFDVPVRFEEQQLRISRKTHLAGELVSIPLIEVRE